MDNEEVRNKILEILYEHGDKDTPFDIDNIDLIKKIGIENKKLEFNVNYLKQKGFITGENCLGGHNVRISHKGIDYIENNEEYKSSITQHFHGDIEQLAFGDINNYNTTIYLNALIKAIEENKSIPPKEKENLIDKTKGIANNPYISSIGATAIFEGIKALSMGVKPF